MREKLSALYGKDGTKAVLSSLISILIGMAVGTVVMIVVAVLVNWKIMIPFYMTAYGMPMEAVVGMATKAVPFVDTEWKLLLCVTAPFNLLKGVVLSSLTFVLYKHLSPLLHVRR